MTILQSPFLHLLPCPNFARELRELRASKDSLAQGEELFKATHTKLTPNLPMIAVATMASQRPQQEHKPDSCSLLRSKSSGSLSAQWDIRAHMGL